MWSHLRWKSWLDGGTEVTSALCASVSHSVHWRACTTMRIIIKKKSSEIVELLWMSTVRHRTSLRWILLSLLKMDTSEPGESSAQASSLQDSSSSSTANPRHSRTQEVNVSPLLPRSFLSWVKVEGRVSCASRCSCKVTRFLTENTGSESCDFIQLLAQRRLAAVSVSNLLRMGLVISLSLFTATCRVVSHYITILALFRELCKSLLNEWHHYFIAEIAS